MPTSGAVGGIRASPAWGLVQVLVIKDVARVHSLGYHLASLLAPQMPPEVKCRTKLKSGWTIRRSKRR